MRMPTSGNVQRASAAAKGLDLASQVRCPSDPSPGADVAGVGISQLQMWRGPSPVLAQMWQRSGSRNYTRPIYSRNARQWFSSLFPMCGSKVEGYACER